MIVGWYTGERISYNGPQSPIFTDGSIKRVKTDGYTWAQGLNTDTRRRTFPRFQIPDSSPANAGQVELLLKQPQTTATLDANKTNTTFSFSITAGELAGKEIDIAIYSSKPLGSTANNYGYLHGIIAAKFDQAGQQIIAQIPTLGLLWSGKNYFYCTYSEGGKPAIPCGLVLATGGSNPENYNVITYNGGLIPVFRYFSQVRNGHFYTGNPAEAGQLYVQDKSWSYEGISYWVGKLASANCTAGWVPLYRFWNPATQAHFYTRSPGEAENLKRTGSGWQYEKIAFCARAEQGEGYQAVARFWSAKFRRHFFSGNPAEIESLKTNNPNWLFESTAFYAVLN